MPDNDDLKAALVALGLLGLGAAGYMALSTYEKRLQFEVSLRKALGERGIGLVSAELGRNEASAPVWFVTVNHPWTGIQQYSLVFQANVDPYAIETLQALVRRLFGVMPVTS